MASQSIVYGEDDRVEVYQAEDPAVAELARSSVVALIEHDRLYRPRAGEVRITGPSLGEAYGLCEGERFSAQQAVAECSGVLIDDNLIVTAGHCFVDDQDCDRYAYVFDYYYEEAGKSALISNSDVYRCRRIVARELSADSDPVQVDYAVVELDRAPRDRRPAQIRTEPLGQAMPLVTIGTTSGLPMKIDPGATLLEPRESILDFFTLDADTFEGSSGSGIFDAEGHLAGILVRGGVDYEEDPGLECLRARVVADAYEDVTEERPLPGEQATYVSQVVQGVCDAGYPAANLCGDAGSCGDGVCGMGESRLSCPGDCDPCGTGTCVAKRLGGEPRGAGDADPDDASGKLGTMASEGGCQLGSGSAASVWWLALVGLGWSRRRRTVPR